VFIQLLNIPENELAIPDHAGAKSSAVSFGNLRNAQAFGDREALLSAGRNVLTILIKQDIRTILTLI
jgi:hypothetical protein